MLSQKKTHMSSSSSSVFNSSSEKDDDDDEEETEEKTTRRRAAARIARERNLSSFRSSSSSPLLKNDGLVKTHRRRDIFASHVIPRLKKIKYDLKKRASVLEVRLREKDEALRTQEEELKEVKKELVKYAPTPLWKVLTDVQYKDIFERHILYKLDELSFRVFREVNTESRDAIRRAKKKVSDVFARYTWEWFPPVQKSCTEYLKGKEARYYFCSEAARSGNLELLRWLRVEKKFVWNTWTIENAASCGHLHIVKYCMEHKCPTNILACAFAARNGHLDILKYLHENGAPWDYRTCFWARENNHLECLLYALDNRCPNDKHQIHY